MIVNFVYLEAALERIPKEIFAHPCVKSDAKRRRKKPSKILLDDSKHHAAMKHLRKKEKRGRPDLLHVCLLSLLDSPFRKNFRVFVHTLDGKLIWINSLTRIPRNYNRFVGLIEDLFEKKVIKAGNQRLLEIMDLDLDSLFRKINPPVTILMRESGKRLDLRDYIRHNSAVCIGAFPHGDFENETLNILNRYNLVEISLGSESFTSLYVTNKIVCIYEEIICENLI